MWDKIEGANHELAEKHSLVSNVRVFVLANQFSGWPGCIDKCSKVLGKKNEPGGSFLGELLHWVYVG